MKWGELCERTQPVLVARASVRQRLLGALNCSGGAGSARAIGPPISGTANGDVVVVPSGHVAEGGIAAHAIGPDRGVSERVDGATFHRRGGVGSDQAVHLGPRCRRQTRIGSLRDQAMPALAPCKGGRAGRPQCDQDDDQSDTTHRALASGWRRSLAPHCDKLTDRVAQLDKLKSVVRCKWLGKAMAETFTYAGFISYSSKDAGFAKLWHPCLAWKVRPSGRRREEEPHLSCLIEPITMEGCSGATLPVITIRPSEQAWPIFFNRDAKPLPSKCSG